MMLLWSIACTTAPEPVQAAERHVPNARARRVEVAQIQDGPPPSLTLTLPGEVEGSRDVMLSSALGGQVERVSIQRGDAVRKGQVIARIDTEIHDAQLAIAVARYAQAEAEYDRLLKMGELVTESQRLGGETTKKVAHAQLRSARAMKNRSVITAPFSGVAADVYPDVGEFLGPGSPVARVVSLTKVKITLAVADKDVVGLEPGMEVRVATAAAGAPTTGRIVQVGRAADLRTRAFPVDVEVNNEGQRLLPGMIATVQVDHALPSGTLAIPQDWIVSRRAAQGVFLESDGFAKWAPVTLGGVLHDQIIVEKGLAVGDRLIVSGHRDLVDGDPVLIAREGRCCERGRAIYGLGN